jgi:hypothetical protein
MNERVSNAATWRPDQRVGYAVVSCLLLVSCGACPEPCVNQFTGAEVQQEPESFSNEAATVCVNETCGQGAFGAVATTGGASWSITLDSGCFKLLLTRTTPSGTFVGIGPADPTCAWSPLKLGDKIELRIVDPNGNVVFDKTHTVTVQGENSCGTPCDRLALKF